jgi:hypothetical protein
MANIIDIYKGSEFAKIGKSNADKTPISADEKNKLNVDEAKLKKARGGQLREKKYSDTIKK